MTDRAALLIRRRRPIGESPDLEPGSVGGAAVLRGSTGAGRVLHALAEHGLPLPHVIQSVHDPETTPAELDALDLGRRFATVVLGSHLVNVVEAELRAAWLRAASRHLVAGGRLLVEHHPIDWAETAEPTMPTPGTTVGMEDVRRHPPFVSAVSTFDIGARFERQPFTARVLSDPELDAALAEAGLRRERRLSPTWLEAVPAVPGVPGQRR